MQIHTPGTSYLRNIAQVVVVVAVVVAELLLVVVRLLFVVVVLVELVVVLRKVCTRYQQDNVLLTTRGLYICIYTCTDSTL